MTVNSAWQLIDSYAAVWDEWDNSEDSALWEVGFDAEQSTRSSSYLGALPDA